MTTGIKFSQVYLDMGAPVNDSPRVRNRVSAFYWEILTDDSIKLVSLIHKETGAKVPFLTSSYSLSSFFERCETRDFLDSITIIYKYFIENKKPYKAKQWYKFISRIFKEENLGYRLDDQGGVHFYIDEEFERARASVISGLSNHPAVNDSFSKAYAFLDATPPDTSSAVKSIFEALEILYKHIVKAEGKDRLNSHGVQKKIKQLFQEFHKSNPIEVTATDHLMDSFCDWIEAGHMYRHGQKVDEPAPPSLDFAVLYVSQGASYLRALLKLA
jgi:hypothetical protein